LIAQRRLGRVSIQLGALAGPDQIAPWIRPSCAC
jgi:hypothetical protein